MVECLRAGVLVVYLRPGVLVVLCCVVLLSALVLECFSAGVLVLLSALVL